MKMFRRWKATVRCDTQHWAAMSLFDMPWPTSSATWRSIGVSLSCVDGSRLRAVSPDARSSWRGAGGQRLGAQVLEGLQRGPQVGARVDAALRCGAGTPRTRGGSGPGRTVGRQGWAWCARAALEQGGRVAGFGEQGAAVVDGGQRPRPPGALGERDQLLHPDGGLFAVTGADGGVDAVEGDETAQRAQPDAGEVVQRGRGCRRRGRRGCLAPTA